MQKNEIIETIGSITKMEHLRSLQKDVLDNTLVLKNVKPFPGYKTQNNNLSVGNIPGSLFIILRYRYAPEKINRINKGLSEHSFIKCYPSFGEIITHDSILPCIRVKGITDYSTIPQIQNYFKNNDLQLLAYKNIDEAGRIKIFKTFKLVELVEGIYRDLNEGEKFYIKIPKSMNWKRFDYITKKIRFNTPNRNFDAALGMIYRFRGPEDVIRIFDEDKTIQRAIELRKLYHKEIKKEIPISFNVPH